MGLWIDGGQTVDRQVDGVTLHIRIMSATEMIGFLRKTETMPESPDETMIDVYLDLVKQGCSGWSADGAPAFGDGSLRECSFSALDRILRTIISVNTLSGDEAGN